MEIYVKHWTPLNTVLIDADGRELYRTNTPFKVLRRNRHTYVSKVFPGNEDSEETQLADLAWNIDGVQCSLVQGDMAQTSWRRRWKCVGARCLDSALLKARQTPWCDRSRTFIASDGRTYKWRMTLLGPKVRALTKRRIVVFVLTMAPCTTLAHFGRRSPDTCHDIPSSACLEQAEGTRYAEE